MKVLARDLRYCCQCQATCEHKRETLDDEWLCVKCGKRYGYQSKDFRLPLPPSTYYRNIEATPCRWFKQRSTRGSPDTQLGTMAEAEGEEEARESIV